MEAEKELKFLLKTIPQGLSQCKSKKMIDIYIPRKAGHAAIRIRQQGDQFFITKKTVVMTEGVKVLNEETIQITEEDFMIFSTMEKALILDKTRYDYPLGNNVIEVDIFGGKLNGLALAEVEFNSIEGLKAFTMPEFCLVNVTDKDFLAGGVLYKLSYPEIEKDLSTLGYQPLFISS